MLPIMTALFTFIARFCRSSTSLRLENQALRHQLAVYKQTVPRPRLRRSDRLLWAWLSRVWSRWHEALAFVQPRTVIAWQRKRFREHWRRLSQQGGTLGRPAIAKDIRDLIRAMWQANPAWGSPRIVGELRKLRITVAKSTMEKYRAPTDATLAHLEDLPEKPHEGPGGPRFLHRADGDVQGAFCPRDPGT